ncbi:MAG: hypothetical protein AB7G09_21905 [Pseudonocardia sp.]
MWAFLWARLRMWLLLALVAPLVAWLLGLIGDAVEARRGPNDLSRGLQWARSWLRHRSRGPWARRAADPTGPADPGMPVR